MGTKPEDAPDNFEEQHISFEGGEFVAAPDGSVLTAAIMPVIAHRGSLVRQVGTCFNLTSWGLCMTARHSIEDAWPEAFDKGRQPTAEDGGLSVFYDSGLPNPDDPDQTFGGLIDVHEVYTCDDLDIAILLLRTPRHVITGKQIALPAMRLGLGPPRIGEHCYAVGYHASNWAETDLAMEVNQKLSSSRGTVEELHIPMRDTHQLRFPCFRTSARYDGGMSGGPVFMSDGLVRGIVCSSILNDGDHISYASLVAPSVLLQTRALTAEGLGGANFLWDHLTKPPPDARGVFVSRTEREITLQIANFRMRNVI